MPAGAGANAVDAASAIGANTAIFSFVDAVLLQRLAVAEPDRLVTFARTHRGERTGVVWTSRTVDALAERTPAFAGVFGWFSRPINLSAGGDGGGWVNGELVTGRYYRTLGVSPAVGRLLDDDDVRNAGADPVCVLGYGLWQRAFGGDLGVVGRTVFLNGRGYRVVGVAERGFHGAELHRRFDIGVPATRAGDFLPTFRGAAGALRLDGLSWLVPMARLQDGVTRAEAERQARLALRAIDPDRQGELWLDDGAQGFNTVRPAFGAPVLVAMALASLVLLVACANLANLLLARARARAGELGVRLCLGLQGETRTPTAGGGFRAGGRRRARRGRVVVLDSRCARRHAERGPDRRIGRARAGRPAPARVLHSRDRRHRGSLRGGSRVAGDAPGAGPERVACGSARRPANPARSLHCSTAQTPGPPTVA